MLELIRDTPDRRLELLCEDDALHATWSRFGPGLPGAGLHIHRHHTDVFHVLAGELTVLRPDGVTAFSPGTFVVVPPFVAHGFANRGTEPLEYLNFHAPGLGFADYLRGLVRGETVPFDQEPPPETGTRPFSDVTVLTGRTLALGDTHHFRFGDVEIHV